MKIKQLILIGLLGLTANWASAQLTPANANFVFTLPGTLTPTTSTTVLPTDNFSFSIRLNYPGPVPADILSLSYWLEVPTAFAPFITITTQTIADGSPGSPSPFNTNLAPSSDFPMAFSSTAADAGRKRTDGAFSGGDLGGSAATAISPSNSSTYYISTLTFHLAGAPIGSYSLQTTLSPPTSVSNSIGTAFSLPQATYTINVVPEPATWSLMALGGLGTLGMTLLRARRKN